MKKLIKLAILWYYRIYFKLLFILLPRVATSKAIQLFSTPLNQKVRSREQEVLNTSGKSHFEYEGLKINIYEWGSGPKTALLVHGWAGNAGSLGAFAQPLVDKGYKVIAFDGPAHGNSEGKQTNLFHFSELLIRLFDIYHPELLISHSFGSAASLYALEQANNNTVKQVVMLTTPDRFEDIITDFTTIMKISDKNRNRMFQYIEDRYGKKVHEMEVSKTIQQLSSVEFLVIHSRSDRVLDFNNSIRVANNHSNAHLEIIDRIGHYRMLWNKEVLDKVFAFIARKENIRTT